jgi:hypothetical protein
MTIIGISGKATAGKDTVAYYYSKYSKDRCTILHFADSLKDCCQGLLIPFGTYDMSLQETKKLIIPWMGKDYTVRNLLQDVGNAFRDSITPDFWVNIMIGKIAAINKNGSIDTILIPDVRYPNEFRMIKDLGGEVWRVERPNIEIMNHVSEIALDDYTFDKVIENKGTITDLQNTIKCLK